MLAVVAVAVTMLLMVSMLARAQSGRGSAQAAADLAALAGAGELARTGPAPGGDEVRGACAVARETARANGCVLTSCDYRGSGVLDVSASRATAVGTAVAVARAGPDPATGAAGAGP